MSTLTQEPEVITRRGKPVSVIQPIKQYQEILERLEDVAWLKKARRKPLHYRPLTDVLADRAHSKHLGHGRRRAA